MKHQLRLLSGRKIESPIGSLTRPTTALVREAVMNILNQQIINSHWLDLYSGSGIMGCEAIQRGAKTILAIESNRKTYKTCLLNLSTIALNNKRDKEISITVLNGDVNKILQKGYKKYCLRNSNAKRFNFIFIDPPYKSNAYETVLTKLIEGDWIQKKALAICEFSIKDGINIPSNWIIKDKKHYGKTGLLFLNPNLE